MKKSWYYELENLQQKNLAVFLSDLDHSAADGQLDGLTDGQTDQPMDGQTFL